MTVTRVIAINRYYAPDHSATAQLLTDLAENLAQAGTPVTVITSRLNYDDPAATLPPRETLNGVTIRRVWTTRFGRAGLWGRALDYASFYLSATLALLAEARRGDTILAKTDPPLISIPAAFAARLKGANLVNWCQDLFPETAAGLGLRWAAGPLGSLLRRLRNWSLNQADCNVVLCDSMLSHLRSEGVAAARLRVVHNWPDPAIQPVPRNRRPGDPFTICYSGNLGLAHNVDAIIDLIERTRDLNGLETARFTKPAMHDPRMVDQGEEGGGGDADTSSRTSDEAPGRSGAAAGAPPTASVGLHFRFVGGGVGQARLKAAAARHGWTHLRFEPYAQRHDLARSLADCDAHLVSLDPACEGLIQPSKVYGVLAVGRPVLFLGAKDGGLARLLKRHAAGLVLDVEAPDGWAATLQALVDDPARQAAMGRNARTAHEARYARPLALAGWCEAIGHAEAAADAAVAVNAAPAGAAGRTAA